MFKKWQRLAACGSAALVGLDALLVLHQSIDLGQQVLRWWA